MQCGFGIGFFLASLAWLFISPLGPGAWRYMLLLGVLPGLLTLWVRRSIPESDKWEHANDKRIAALKRQRSGATLAAIANARWRASPWRRCSPIRKCAGASFSHS